MKNNALEFKVVFGLLRDQSKVFTNRRHVRGFVKTLRPSQKYWLFDRKAGKADWRSRGVYKA